MTKNAHQMRKLLHKLRCDQLRSLSGPVRSVPITDYYADKIVQLCQASSKPQELRC